MTKNIPVLPILFVFIFLLCCGKPSQVDAASEYENIFKEQRNLPHGSMLINRYFDMHGNANKSLQKLIKARFDATDPICRELDKIDSKKRPTYAMALYHVLGYVKDPASIKWLEKICSDGRSNEIKKYYLSHWKTFLRGAGYEDLKWIEGSEQWSGFFINRFKSERFSRNRIPILRAMQGWLHDPGTLDFFTELEKSPSTKGEELLIAQVYLHQHGKPYNVERLKETFEEFKSKKGGIEILLPVADEIRDELFVPWLISIAGKTYKVELGSRGEPQTILEEITFKLNILDKEGWNNWYNEHGTEGRKAWVDQAFNQIEDFLHNDPDRAKIYFKKAMYRWNDMIFFSHAKELLQYKSLHNELTGWINLTYRTCWRKQLHSLADEIIDQNESDLENWAAGILKNLDFLEDKDATWDRHVSFDNMRL